MDFHVNLEADYTYSLLFQDPNSPEKFHVELHFSPGAYTSIDKNVVNPASSGYRTSFLSKVCQQFSAKVFYLLLYSIALKTCSHSLAVTPQNLHCAMAVNPVICFV